MSTLLRDTDAVYLRTIHLEIFIFNFKELRGCYREPESKIQWLVTNKGRGLVKSEDVHYYLCRNGLIHVQVVCADMVSGRF